MVKKRIFPLTRIHEPMQVDVEVNNGRVTDAWISGTLFRGFELMLQNRDPRDTPIYSQRICGICSTAHAYASTLALEDAYGIKPSPNGAIIRNLIFSSDFIQNHLRQFYVLAMPDYARGPDTPPFRPLLKGDYRIPPAKEKKIYENFWKATELSAKAHQMVAIWGAKAPHQQTIIPGGVTEKPTTDKITMFMSLLQEMENFINDHYIPDVYTIIEHYPEYFEIGKGYGNLISFGAFTREDSAGSYFKGGIIKNFSKEIAAINDSRITEEVISSWYSQAELAKHPFEETTIPDRNKPQAYSWIKTPLYHSEPVEGGPIARLWLNGKYQRGVSVNDRNIARALELKELTELMHTWIEKLNLQQPTFIKYEPQFTARGAGLTDSMRGPLGHWIKIKDGRTSHYQVITPSSWNFAARDSKNRRGPVEEALIDTPVEDTESLIEVGRVIRSFDPCFSCAVHAVQGDKTWQKYKLQD
ncbi:MAG: nickel-dependent hydrogenase large subunit [Peptococcaceae bacterium]